MATPRKILCPVDFSEGSLAALEEALVIAEALDAKVDLLHVWQLPTAFYAETVVWPQPTWDLLTRSVEEAARKSLERLVASLAEPRRARMTTRLVLGDPTTAILEQATVSGSDLIVMGTHGRRGLSGFLMGSVTARVLRHAPCPVISVRRPREKTRIEVDSTTQPGAR
jgi:universal stress protein A